MSGTFEGTPEYNAVEAEVTEQVNNYVVEQLREAGFERDYVEEWLDVSIEDNTECEGFIPDVMRLLRDRVNRYVVDMIEDMKERKEQEEQDEAYEAGFIQDATDK